MTLGKLIIISGHCFLSSVKYGHCFIYYKVAIIKKIMHMSEYCKFGPRINTRQVVSFVGFPVAV